jgi:hypothetical protein
VDTGRSGARKRQPPASAGRLVKFPEGAVGVGAGLSAIEKVLKLPDLEVRRRSDGRVAGANED